MQWHYSTLVGEWFQKISRKNLLNFKEYVMSVEPIERLGSIQYSPKLPERVPNEVPKISAGVYKLHLDLLCAY